MRELTTTSYLILGMLANRDWSAYEIAEQISRGVSEIWPRANRGLYNVPKGLVEHGFANATVAQTGARRRTTYSITSAGLKALGDWLADTSKPSALEFEGMVRVILADRGELDDLRKTLATIAEQAGQSRDTFAGLAEQMLDPSSRVHPERLHLMAIANRFMIDHFCNLYGWASWALEMTATWDDTTSSSPTRLDAAEAILRESIRRAAKCRDG